MWGWGDARVIGLALAAVAAFALFAVVQRRKGADALVPSDVIRHRDFAGACVAIAMSGISFGAVLLFLPQIVQKVLDGNALESGLTLLPLLLTYALISFVAPKLAKKVARRPCWAAARSGWPRGWPCWRSCPPTCAPSTCCRA